MASLTDSPFRGGGNDENEELELLNDFNNTKNNYKQFIQTQYILLFLMMSN